MTSHVKSWMFFSFSATVFVIALGSAIYLNLSISKSLDLVSKSNTHLERDIHSTLGVPVKPAITGQEVAASVIQIPDTKIDIIVNNHLYNKNLQFDEIDVSTISLNREYTANFERNTLGVITKVIYTAQ
ncbi:hypothetical protein ABER99_20005 [Paenibacillus glucanolyticus]|uniref:Uncharacterized protein n=1 Tax=Paenibacillus glucanolyticus TaxID=59843 RepID=A0A163GNV0_9BACL|nr:hypothetical protein [Paenibacillus glucanolyticus]KZS45066.1 hypothetical protein AWU65_03530 [Paenibacillus glucanolyticus]OMF64125.1 hypothetical protein BK142_32190 [Paenibacillus glucanolyticus]